LLAPSHHHFVLPSSFLPLSHASIFLSCNF
jgi:hypothetical protein